MKVIKLSPREFLVKEEGLILSISTRLRVPGGYCGGDLIPANNVVTPEEWNNLVSKGFKVEDINSEQSKLYAEVHNAGVDEEYLLRQEAAYAWACEHWGMPLPASFKF